MKMKKGFSLVEVLLTLTLIGVMAVGFLPVLTKRMKGPASGCTSNFQDVKKVFYYTGAEQNFVVPKNIASDVVITLVDGGSGGAAGFYAEESGLIQDSSSCTLPVLKTSNAIDTRFYANVVYNAVRSGESTTCASNQAGASGAYIYNLKLDIPKTASANNINNVFSHTISQNNYFINNVSNTINTDGIVPSWSPSRSGDEDSSMTIKTLYGGIPLYNIVINNSPVGVGQNCILNSANNTYGPDPNFTAQAGCKITYKIAVPGDGGNSGKYKKFSLSLSPETSCDINIGQGGAGGVSEGSGENGGRTTVTCQENSYNTDGGELSYGQNAITTLISGGKGGNISQLRFPGGDGGCRDSHSSSACTQPYGGNGYLGSGGGGGSCNEVGCGYGGRGGDGFVIIEYKEQCE